MNLRKAELLYNEIDRNRLFVGTAAKEDRSIRCLLCNERRLRRPRGGILNYAKSHGMVELKDTVCGRIRASSTMLVDRKYRGTCKMYARF